ncbi:hypothetical protein K402DRAFT_333136 [Aulographum hederae CBS 113979]|uniref:Vezatin n=1 Tax=Aulographum hederae CBS 113979 TaxID=1176131 RepID=A0A6G1GZR5_9PEZI|nr:hypothetical protein K402DRAFT_333136 [Aulographum hederae CBS 113979]
MEEILYEDSPLAEYLLEGEGTGDTEWTEARGLEAEDNKKDFAPRGPSTLHSKIRDQLPQPLRLSISKDGFAMVQSACSSAVNSRLGRAENARFLDHFRYILVASQLLSEHNGAGAWKPALPNSAVGGPAGDADYETSMTNLAGAVVSGITAFAIAWFVQWSKGDSRLSFTKGRFYLVVAVFGVATVVANAYLRKQWLQWLRRRAVSSASTLVSNLQAFEASTSSAINMVQEVELVSRGYRISYPLPPISRLEDKSQLRRCIRLRRTLHRTFAAAIPAFSEACSSVRQLIQENDLERYLDVYEFTSQDVQEATQGFSETEFEDVEALKVLRVLQYRFSTLRRLFMCLLLSLEADGGPRDLVRWRLATENMQSAANVSGQWSEKINAIFKEEDNFILPTSSTLKAPSTPDRERVRTQVRKLTDLSQGIKGLQAKMQIMREESNQSLESAENIAELGPSLMMQYESIGADLKSLMQAWESGKASLALNIDRCERRISQASSGLRSPATSLGGLTAVEEGAGTPSDALKALNGEIPLLPSSLHNGSSHSQTNSPSANSVSDEEIFEAVAIPRKRMSLTREERIVKLHEDKIRQQLFKEKREQSTSMIRELESVIHLRQPKRYTTGRITSM